MIVVVESIPDSSLSRVEEEKRRNILIGAHLDLTLYVHKEVTL